MANPTRSREKPAPRSWKFGEPGHAIVGYLNNADVGFRRCHEAVHDKIEPYQHTTTHPDGTKESWTISDPDWQADWAKTQIGYRLLRIKDDIVPLLRDWHTYVMLDAAKLRLASEFTARLDDAESAFLRLLDRRDFLTRKPIAPGGERKPRVNHDLLGQRLNRIFDAIARADGLVKFFEAPAAPRGGKAQIKRVATARRASGMTTSQLAERLNCKPKTIARTFTNAKVPTPRLGDHGHLYSMDDLHRVAKWCLGQPHPSYQTRGKAIQGLLESAPRQNP